MKRILFCTLLTAAFATLTFAQDPTPATGEGQVYKGRQAKQQKRITNGVESGKLSAGQAAKLESNQAKMNHEVAKDAAENGGTLTNGEKAKVHHEMKRESKNIARKKNVNPKGPAE